jgi:DNA-3-methyladenine glycosylase II
LTSLLNKKNFRQLCDAVSEKDPDLEKIISDIGYPPFWTRPNSFATLALTILEQQVSLASAFAAFTRLKERLQTITPENFIILSDEELRACYFSRQKIVYVRGLAEAILQKKISLKAFSRQPDETIRTELKKLKGIGDWTVDIYLIHALRHSDILPIGDLALVKAIRESKGLDPTTPAAQLVEIAEAWRPYRSVATMILWNYYIKKRNIRILH